MKQRLLGRTGLSVSELALGGLFVSKFGGERAQSRDAVHRALELGVNYIDTAPTYGDSEEVLGYCLEGVQQPYCISTKLGGRPTPFDPRSRDSLLKSVELSLQALKRDRIDILFIHEPERPEQYDWWTDWEQVEGPVLDTLAELKKDGTIRFTGVAGTTGYKMAHLVRSGKFDVVLTAFNYALLWREAGHEILPAAIEHNVGIVVGSPLQQGSLAQCWSEEVMDRAPWLTTRRREQLRTLYRFVAETGLSLPEIALRWVISNPAIACVLMGARSATEVEQNVAGVNRGALPADILQRLDEIAAMVPFRPAEEPATLRFDALPPRAKGGAR